MDTQMNRFRSLLDSLKRTSVSERYYAGVVGRGEGAPTMDEARRDLREANRNRTMGGWHI